MTAHPGDAELVRPLPPGAMIGILGGGQLGRMLAMAAARLGLKCHIYSDHRGPAFDVAAATTIGAFTDLEAIRAFARAVDVVTYEFENVPLACAEAAILIAPVRPGPKALAVAQDRLTEKCFIHALGIPVAPFESVEDAARLRELLAGAEIQRHDSAWRNPAILKTRRLGYDGKGQVSVTLGSDADAAFAAVGAQPAVLERRIDFQREVSVLLVRGVDGAVGAYDIPVNTHKAGILDRSVVPGGLEPEVTAAAIAMARRIAEALDYVGVLTVELFDLGGAVPLADRLLVNEIAPRVHNSGHWTIDACAVSQFENHIRAVAGWPLGSTRRHSDAVMTNLIGREVDAWPELAAGPAGSGRLAAADAGGTCLHLYGKHEARAGRKMGHVTVLQPLSRRPNGAP